MIRKYILILFFYSFFFHIYAQFELSVNDTVIQKGDTINQIIIDTVVPNGMYTRIKVKNTTSNEQNVFVKCKIISLAPNCDLSMCWGMGCNYILAVQTNDSVQISPNDIYNGLQLNYHPYDIQNQESLFRFTFYDANNLEDSSFVYCRYGIYESNESQGLNLDNIKYSIVDRQIIVSNNFQLINIFSATGNLLDNMNLVKGMYFVLFESIDKKNRIIKRVLINE